MIEVRAEFKSSNYVGVIYVYDADRLVWREECPIARLSESDAKMDAIVMRADLEEISKV